MRITSIIVLILALVNSSDRLLKDAQNSQGPIYEEFVKSQCFTTNTQYPEDQATNPIFGGGGFDLKGTALDCKRNCNDPNTIDSRGRRCVAFEHSSQDPFAVANCAFAWDCSETRHWEGGKVYRRTEVIKPTYEEFGTSQCFTNNARYPGDRENNPIFGGEGYDMVGTARACKTRCDHPNTIDSRGRRCVAFEHSSQDPNAKANCAFAWDCSEIGHWRGGKVYRKIYPAAGSLRCEAKLNEWCTSNTPYRYARFDRSHSSTTKQWRCYSTGALTADTFHVNTDIMPSSRKCTQGLSGGTLDPLDAFCWNHWTRDSQLSGLLEECRQKPTYEVFGKSQCFTSNNALRPGDQADNPIFGGRGFNMVGNADACQTRCDNPNTIDSRGRRCVAFEHSSQDPNAVARCAFAWDCSEIRHWGGGKVYRRTNVSSY